MGICYRQARQGEATETNSYRSRGTASHTHRAWIDHHPEPDGATLAFTVLPDADINNSQSYVLNPEVVVLSQTSDVHAVCHAPSQVQESCVCSAAFFLTWAVILNQLLN